jgi:hypothetical protein
MLNVRGWAAGPSVYMIVWLLVAIHAVWHSRETFRAEL